MRKGERVEAGKEKGKRRKTSSSRLLPKLVPVCILPQYFSISCFHLLYSLPSPCLLSLAHHFWIPLVLSGAPSAVSAPLGASLPSSPWQVCQEGKWPLRCHCTAAAAVQSIMSARQNDPDAHIQLPAWLQMPYKERLSWTLVLAPARNTRSFDTLRYDCPFLLPSSDKQTGRDVGGNSVLAWGGQIQTYNPFFDGLTSVIRETKFCWHASLKHLLLYKSPHCSQWVRSPKSPRNTAGDGNTRKGHFFWQKLAQGSTVQRVQSQKKRTLGSSDTFVYTDASGES